ncbi:MAG: (2Fe-2S)-binding protein [Labilithrix sp.]|nr:(2Fe-2S)-binding protein [Labilithrix sp.]
MHARAVQEKLGSSPEGADVATGWTEQAEAHASGQSPEPHGESKAGSVRLAVLCCAAVSGRRPATPEAARESPRSRVAPLRDPVTITLDGEPIVAERGEPIAAALVAAGKLMVARSPKFHRPRGPSCFRAACDGCLARVDETPNVMTCMTPAREGTAVVSQNRLGPRQIDLLRMTDWFFPEGLDHHELFAGIPGVQNVMQAFARRVAGLGRLPAEGTPPRAAARRDADVVVVGAGPSGMAIASRLARAGRAVEVLDDQDAPGGGLTALDADDASSFSEIHASFMDLVARGRVRLRTSTIAGGVYGRDLLVSGPEGAEILLARALVLASGAHDGVLAFEGNDVPGLMSARAGGWLLRRGVLLGPRVVVVIPEGGGPFGASYARAMARATMQRQGKHAPTVTVVQGTPLRIKGSSRVKGVVVMTAAGKEEALAADAVLVDAPRSPAYELATQAGATVRHEPRGYVVVTDGGRAAEGVYAVGELAGCPLDAAAVDADAARAAATILSV